MDIGDVLHCTMNKQGSYSIQKTFAHYRSDKGSLFNVYDSTAYEPKYVVTFDCCLQIHRVEFSRFTFSLEKCERIQIWYCVTTIRLSGVYFNLQVQNWVSMTQQKNPSNVMPSISFWTAIIGARVLDNSGNSRVALFDQTLFKIVCFWIELVISRIPEIALDKKGLCAGKDRRVNPLLLLSVFQIN